MTDKERADAAEAQIAALTRQLQQAEHKHAQAETILGRTEQSRREAVASLAACQAEKDALTRQLDEWKNALNMEADARAVEVHEVEARCAALQTENAVYAEDLRLREEKIQALKRQWVPGEGS